MVPAARRLAQERGVDLAQVRGTGPRGRILIADVELAVETGQPAAPPGIGASPRQRVQVQVVPAARRLAQERGIDLSQVRGRGPTGRILIADVEQAVQEPSQATDQAIPKTVEIVGIRRTIATRMLQSLQTMAQVTLTTEANVADAMALRAGVSRQWTELSLSPLHLAVKAAARALKDHPRLNAVQEEDQVQLMDEVKHRGGGIPSRRPHHTGDTQCRPENPGADRR